MNKKLKKGLTISSAAAMGMSIVLPTVSVIAAPATMNGWVNTNGTWYYYNNGTMVKNGWAKDSKGWCFLSAVDGSWVQNGWAKDSVGWGYIQNGYWVEKEMWAQDSAGWNHIMPNGYWDGKAAVAVDPTAPVATFEVGSVTVVDATHISVVFTQAVDITSAEDTDNYNFSDDLVIDDAVLQADGKTVLITLEDTGCLDNSDDSYYMIKITDIKNTVGNKIDYKQNMNLYDDVRPEVVSTDVEGDTLTIKFSEVIDDNTLGAIEIDDEDGVDITSDLTIDTDDDDASIVTVKGLIGADDEDTEYTLIVNGTLKDLAENRINPNPYEKAFIVGEDNTDPEVSSVKSLGVNGLKVTFSEAIANDDFDLYIEDMDEALTLGDDYTVADGSDDYSYNVTFVAGGAVNTYEDGDLAHVKIDNFADNAENTGDSKTKYVKMTDSDTDLEATDGVLKTIDSNKYVVFTYNQDLTAVDVEDLDATYIDSDGDSIDDTIDADRIISGIDGDETYNSELDANQIAIKVEGLNEGDYTVTLPDDFATISGALSDKVDVTFSVSEAASSEDVTCKTISNDNPLTDDVEEDDTDVFYVEFSGEVSNTAIDVSNYSADGVSVFGKASYVNSDKEVVKLTLKDGAIKENDDKDVDVEDIEDADGDSVDDETFENTAFVDNYAPKVTKISVDGTDTITVTFNEAIANAAVMVADPDVADNFVVKQGSDSLDIDTVTQVTADGITVFTITLADAIDDPDATITAGTSDDFTGVDAAGNDGLDNSTKTDTL